VKIGVYDVKRKQLIEILGFELIKKVKREEK
jgi:hypothetical protein